MNGRHRKIFFVNCQQYVMDMPPDLRSQVDMVFVMRETIRSNKEKLWKYFFGIFDKFADFNKVLENCTSNFECLVLNNASRSSAIEDCVHWYKAQHPLPPFKLCSEVYWNLSTKYFCDRDAIEDKKDDKTSDDMRTILRSTPNKTTSRHSLSVSKMA